ncbi:MAG: YdbL family protein [Methylobacillus sp.]|jgi:uncharacterized protein YdbL (DUF1318 family)|nr:YdbL family protein [Methylobacillus sp.]
MKKQLIAMAFALTSLLATAPVLAQADLKANTPAVTEIRGNIKARFPQMRPLYESGAVGLGKDGLVIVRDANAVPLRDRQSVNALVADENRDRNALYKEVANANGHPEWEAEIRNTFAQRWADRAHSGWWVQDAGGNWKQKP